MKHKSYGPKLQQRAKLLVMALATLATNQSRLLDFSDIPVSINVKDKEIMVKGHTKDLVKLTKDYYDHAVLTRDQVRESLTLMSDLSLCKDHRTSKRGNPEQHFTLMLDSIEPRTIDQYFEYWWDRARQPQDISLCEKPSPFLLQLLTQRYIERSHIDEQWCRFRSTYRNGYLVLQGKPGTGKTAYLANFLQKHDGLAVFSDQNKVNNPDQILVDLAEQVCNKYPCLSGSWRHGTHVGNAFSSLLMRVSSFLRPDHPLILVIDVPDEYLDPAGNSNLEPLYLWPCLPKYVYILLACRSSILPLSSHSPQLRIGLDDHPMINRHDIKQYIRTMLSENPRLTHSLQEQGWPTEQWIESIAIRSEGNFRYAWSVLQELSFGRIDIDIPDPLRGYYESHFREMIAFSDPFLLSLSYDLITCFSFSDVPLKKEDIAQKIRRDPRLFNLILDRWNPYLLFQDNGMSLFHPSFRKYILERILGI